MLGQITCIALVVFFECSVCNLVEKSAVAYVVKNRAEDTTGEFRRYTTTCSVMRQKSKNGSYHFSFYNNFRINQNRPSDSKPWRDSINIARSVWYGSIHDPTGGAMYYYRKKLNRTWAKGMRRLEMKYHAFFIRPGF